MGTRSNIVLLDSLDPEVSHKAKALKDNGWCFAGRQGEEFVYERYKNPLFQFESSHIFVLVTLVVAFIAMLTSMIFH